MGFQVSKLVSQMQVLPTWSLEDMKNWVRVDSESRSSTLPCAFKE